MWQINIETVLLGFQKYGTLMSHIHSNCVPHFILKNETEIFQSVMTTLTEQSSCWPWVLQNRKKVSKWLINLKSIKINNWKMSFHGCFLVGVTRILLKTLKHFGLDFKKHKDFFVFFCFFLVAGFVEMLKAFPLHSISKYLIPHFNRPNSLTLAVEPIIKIVVYFVVPAPNLA